MSIHCNTKIRQLLAALGLLVTSSVTVADTGIQAWIDTQVADGKVLAASAAHLRGDKLEFYSGGASKPAGGAAIDADSQFQIGSVTKAFTNLLLADMVADGKLSYDTTIADLIGDDVRFANPAVAAITLRQLATHSSGLPRLPFNLAPADPLDPYKGYDETLLLAAVADSRKQQPLGDHYAYSNYGVGLLGYLLGRVHGAGYQAALSEYVLAPLKMSDTGFTASNAAAGFRAGVVVPDWRLDSLDGAGGLWSSASDMMRLAQVLLGDIDNPLAHAIADDLVVSDEGPEGFRVTRVWHAADSDAGTIYWHNGGTGGFWSFFGFRPDTDEALVILVSGDPDPTGLGFQSLGRKPYPVTDVAHDTGLFGQYSLAPDAGIGIYAIGNTLVGQVSGQTPLALDRVDGDWYAVGAVDASVRFVRDGDRVTGLEFVQNGVVQQAQKVADVAASQARETLALPAETLAEYVGEYPINAAAKFTIRLAGDGLEAQITGQPFFPVFARGDDVFFYKVVDAELHFERDESGKVNALVLRQGGIVQRAERAD